MEREDFRSAIEFAVVLSKEYPEMATGVLVDVLVEVMELTKESSMHNENECNIADYPKKYGNRVSKKIDALLKKHGMAAKQQGDPRGFAVKLQLPSGRTNDWGQEGWGVPEICVGEGSGEDD